MAAGGLQGRRRIGDVLHGRRQVALGGGTGLLGAGLGGLLVLELLAVGTHLVLQRLLQHVVVVLGVALGLAQARKLLLGLLLQVLEHVEDVVAVGLVAFCGRRAHAVVVVGVRLLGLHQGHELPLVCACERCGIDDSRQRVHQVVRVGGVDLCEGRRVLLHLALENADGTGDGIDGLHELGLTRGKILEFFVPDLGRGLELAVVGGHAACELLDLRRGCLHIAGGLADGGVELGALVLGSLQLVLRVLRGIVAPLDEIVVRFRLGLTLLRDLRRQGVHQAQDLPERVRARSRRNSTEDHQGEERHGAGKLHCSQEVGMRATGEI
mmetsp:Transcript_63313/g.166029  ORF Transcript_63313/g.166029 Transcript_63313/m.166029 type:complete len:324 (+) Transcript_63313:1223-2194(+)